jgi:hypothetical protein
MSQEEMNTLLEFFKVLANESRLKIVGILAGGERTVGELAAMLGVKEPTVSQHLSMLKHNNLVSVRSDGNYRYYAFNPKTLEALSKNIFSREGLASLVVGFDDIGDAYERKVFQTFFDGERLLQFPASDKKWLVILRWLADRFEWDRRYTEKQVNEILTRHHEDYVTIRRELVERGFMQRERGVYWRVGERAASDDVAVKADAN